MASASATGATTAAVSSGRLDWLAEGDIVHLIVDAVAMDLASRGRSKIRPRGGSRRRAAGAADDLLITPIAAASSAAGHRAAVADAMPVPLHRRRRHPQPHGDRAVPSAPCRPRACGMCSLVGAAALPRSGPGPAWAGGAGRHEVRANGPGRQPHGEQLDGRGQDAGGAGGARRRTASSARSVATNCPRLWRGRPIAWRGCSGVREAGAPSGDARRVSRRNRPGGGGAGQRQAQARP